MNKIFFGLLLVFLKLNINFLDISLTYSLSNLIGYVLIFLGVKELSKKYNQVEKIQPLVGFMVFHSLAFLILNASGNSPLLLPLDSYLAVISYAGLAFVIAGMFIVYVIISRLIEALEEEKGVTSHTKRLKKLTVIMMLAFVVLGMLYFLFSALPGISQMLMGVLIMLQIIFLIEFYNTFLKASNVAAER
ncbi:hypothetical protein JMA_10070 [Jeotgalibacillus malaysiensis]|uniref:Uncharacterized protein n=1 Tax=Jeotgalibacillus malaysiensis TaxID=1508404 RepID=A0A0B5AQJ2_9BACL|nr:hypothetical protein [Jeotgalibacillus malaysiensis]AJD90324.1 hypothetical protein JMA_10070 [Jeotgalibacillus malaysiensis]